MKTKIYLVRHGKTEWNEKGKLQGWSDIPLSELGKIEANTAAESLKKEKVHAIYSSPLSRALQTAEEIARHHKLHVTTHEELKEGGYGVFEGMTWKEVENHEAFKNAVKPRDRFYDSRGDGETIHDVYLRATKRFDSIIAQHPHETIVVVSHALVMKTLAFHMKVVDKEQIERIIIANAYPMSVWFHHTTRTFEPIEFPLTYYEPK